MFFFFFSCLGSAVSLTLCNTWTRAVKKRERCDASAAAWVRCWATPLLIERRRALGPQRASRQLQTCSAPVFADEVCGRRRGTGKSLSVAFSSVLPTIILREGKVCFDLDHSQVCVCVLKSLIAGSCFPQSQLLLCPPPPSFTPWFCIFGLLPPKNPGRLTQFGCWWILKSHRSSWEPSDPITPEWGERMQDEMSAWQHLVFPRWSVYSVSVSLSCGHVESCHWCCQHLKLFDSQNLQAAFIQNKSEQNLLSFFSPFFFGIIFYLIDIAVDV